MVVSERLVNLCNNGYISIAYEDIETWVHKLTMFGWSRMVAFVLLSAVRGLGVMPVDSNKITDCEEFEFGARFNPYEIMDSMWKIFYFWANRTEINPIIFSLPSKNRVNNLKMLVETADPDLDLEWHKLTLMMEPRKGLIVLFLYATTPGAFLAVVIQHRFTEVRPHPLPYIKLASVRLKLVERYIGMMCCEDLTAYALARIDEMPTTEEDCEAAAAKFNIDLPDAHSYLFVHKLADEL